MSKKKIIVEVIEENLQWGHGISIDDLQSEIIRLEKKGATNINIKAEHCWGDSILVISADCERLETDEEYALRIQKELDEKVRIELYERKELERLKKKYYEP